jgi:hypothetical protein
MAIDRQQLHYLMGMIDSVHTYSVKVELALK